ncbi:MAG: TetR/AcrR family transcriptional regulator [Candidatus Pelagadaptatus aseana]
MADKDYHHGDLRVALIDAANAMIDKNGAGDFSLRKVSQSLGVSQSALYRHFSGKDALLAAVAEQGFLDMAARMERAYQSELEAEARLRSCAEAYVNFACEHPNLYRLMFGELLADRQNFPELAAARSEVFKWPMQCLLQHNREQGREDSELREGDKLLIQSLVHGLSSLMIENLVTTRLSREQIIQEVTPLMVFFRR